MAKKAFLVGVNTDKLKYCERDADLMSACLKDKNDYDIVRPTIDRSSLDTEFNNFVGNCDYQDIVILYFSGHGLPKGAELFFPLIEHADTDNEININDWLKKFSRSKAKNKLVILDCCNSGTAYANWSPAITDRYWILTATDQTGRSKEIESWRAGFLTHNIHEGLSNPPPEIIEPDGKVFVTKLYDWLRKKTLRYNLDNPNDHVPVPNLLGNHRSDIEIISATSTSQHDIQEPLSEPEEFVPNPPSPFWNREELETLANALLPEHKARKSLLIFGDPGTGKTSLILKSLHDKKVKDEYGVRRFFVSCRDKKSKEGIIDAIRIQVSKLHKDLTSSEDLEFLDYICNRDQNKYLIALDDVDQALFADLTKVGGLIAYLAKRSTVIASLNYSYRSQLVTWEDDVPWNDPIFLNPINHAQATEIFKLITKRSDEKAAGSNQLIDQILDKDGATPLILSLAARRSKIDDYRELAKRWKSLRNRLRSEGKMGRNKIGIAYEFALESPVFEHNHKEVVDELARIAHKDDCLSEDYISDFRDAGFTDPARKDRLSPTLRNYLTGNVQGFERRISHPLPHVQENSPSGNLEDVSHITKEPGSDPIGEKDYIKLLEALIVKKLSDPK